MLVARRDPPFKSGDYDILHAPGHAAPRSSRIVMAFQLIGSLVAIPVGLASAYSVYQSNFSAEAKCNSLRANIIGVLDRSADASTLRALARRDVVAFETSCAAVDPDAVAAFKSLLADKIAPRPVAVAPPQQVREPVRQVEAPKAPVAKAPPPVAKSEAPRREAAAADAKWIASVRHALEHKRAERADVAEPQAVVPLAPGPQVFPQPLVIHGAAAAPAIAPALPAGVPVASAPAPSPDIVDHPVPPASIPDARAAGKAGPSKSPFGHRPLAREHPGGQSSRRSVAAA